MRPPWGLTKKRSSPRQGAVEGPLAYEEHCSLFSSSHRHYVSHDYVNASIVRCGKRCVHTAGASALLAGNEEGTLTPPSLQEHSGVCPSTIRHTPYRDTLPLPQSRTGGCEKKGAPQRTLLSLLPLAPLGVSASSRLETFDRIKSLRD